MFASFFQINNESKSIYIYRIYGILYSYLCYGRKAMTNLDGVLKSRDITLPAKFRIVKAMFFFSSHVWMWELDHKEGWLPKNWCFWTVVLEKTLENPLNIKEINPNLKEINSAYSLEGLVLKLKLQDFCHLMWRDNSLEKTLMQGKIECKRRRWQRMRQLDGITSSMGKLREIVKEREAWYAAIHGVTKNWAYLRDQITTIFHKL